MYNAEETWLYKGASVCSCCGSWWGKDVPENGVIPNPKGISIHRGVAKELDTKITLRKVIQTKNGPITIAMAKAQ